jgi:predicted DNA-binding ribbon-helix-helix protein
VTQAGGTGADQGSKAARLRASRPVKRSFSIRGHRTSISLEQAFWEALQAIARERGLPLVQLVGAIDEGRGDAGLSGAVRVFILDHYRSRARIDPAGPGPAA